MDSFIQHVKREMIYANVGAAFYAGTSAANLVTGMQTGMPTGVVFCALGGVLAQMSIREASKSMRSAKILDQARAQQQEES